VTTSEQVRRLADVGASFVVSPGLDEVVVEAALACGLVPVPGVATGSEVLAARRAGADLFKLFPAGGLGLPYFSQLLGPFRTEQFVPTGGIGLDDVSSWLEAGAHAVALGAALAGRQAPAGAAEVDALRTRAVSALAHARSGSTSR
jgi:Entner-Doudoroff aldolase